MKIIGRLLSSVCLALFASGCHTGSQVEHGNVAFDVSPDGHKIVFSAADGDLYLLDRETLNLQRLTHSTVMEMAPTFSPDGKTIVYAAGVSGQAGDALYILSLNQKSRRLTSDTSVSDYAPSFSPNGSKVTFARAHRYRPYSMGGMTWSDYDVYVMNTNGTGVKRLTNRKYYRAGRPHFSPDAKDILYAADEPYDGEFSKKNDGGSMRTIIRVSVSGTDDPQLILPLPKPGLQIGALGDDPNPSSDSKRVAFISDKSAPFKYDVCTMRLDGSDIRPLHITQISTYNRQPTFLPGGKSLLFLAGTESNAGNRPIFSLWQVDIDGHNAHQIADSGLFTAPSRWRPKR